MTVLAALTLLALGPAVAAPPGHARHPQFIAGQRRAEADSRARAFPLGYIPPGAISRALDQIQQAEALTPRPNDLGLGVWHNIGPAAIGNSVYADHKQASGRVPVVAVDPSKPAHWLIGAAQGGVWETSDAGLTWHPRTDDQASLAIGAITFDPNNPTVVFAGTGEPNFRGSDYAGQGLLVSHDGGTTWQMLDAEFAQSSFSRILVCATNSQRMAVATVRGGAGITDAGSGTNLPPTAPTRGIHISGDGGSHFTPVLQGEATALEANPVGFDQQYAGLGEIYGSLSNGVYRTSDAWAHAQLVNGPWTALASPMQMGRIAMALAPTDPNILYVGVAKARVNYVSDLVGIWYTTNAWAATPIWFPLSDPPVRDDAADGEPANTWSSPRFWYHFALLVDAQNPRVLYLAEFDVWRYNPAQGWTQIVAYTNNVVHPDNHAMAWVPGVFGTTRMLLGNDGGVWVSQSSVSTGSWQTLTWLDLNPGLAISQIYKGALDPTGQSALALAGILDNGTALNTGSAVWPYLDGGDGGDCAISSAKPNTHWAYSYQTEESVDILRTQDSGPGDPVGYGINSSVLPFYTQFYVHFEKSPAIDDLFIAGTAQLWRCDNFFTGTSPAWSANSPTMINAFGAPVPISAMAFAPSDTAGQIYAFGTEDGQLRITQTGGGTGSAAWRDLDPANAVPGRYISGLAFSPTDPKVLYVTLSGFDEGTPGHVGHVFKTSNALDPVPVWMNVSPPPDLPMNCVAIDPNDAQTIFVGSDFGVWRTSDGGNSWVRYGPESGMPNVAVYDLRMSPSGRPTAFTHGRGAFAYQLIPFPNIVLGALLRCRWCPPVCLNCLDPSVNPQDWVTIDFPLQNTGALPTQNLTATMLRSDVVTPITGSQSYGVLLPQGDAVSRSFSFSVTGACGATVSVALQLQDGTNNLGQVTVPFRLGVPNFPLAESFDELLPPALPSNCVSTVSGYGNWWTTTTNPPPNLPVGEGEDSPPLSPATNISVFVPDASGPGESILTFDPFLVTGPQAQLYFRHAFRLANTNDGAVLEMSIAGQPFADVIRLGGAFTQDGYNVMLGGRNPLGSRPGWSGDSGGWLPTFLTFPPGAVGQPVQLRWRLGTSVGSTNGGWFIDSVMVIDPTCPPPVTNPVMVNVRTQGQFILFSINTVSNRTYTIETKSNLTDSTWQALQSFVGTGGLQDISARMYNPGTGFFHFIVH